MGTIRENLKEKFNNWLDQRCDKGEATYNHTLDDCPDDKYDWRDMLIEELLDGLQYQEKEIKRLKKALKEIDSYSHHLAITDILDDALRKPPYADLDD